MSEQEIYIEAMNRRDPADRRQFLDEACAGNEVLLERIETLIRQSDQLGSFLEKSPRSLRATADVSIAVEKPGTQIGPYKLLQQIGEGGMGVVYMAEQEQPVRRRVGLKIIKPGMDSRQVIARFEAERQALSLMDHPNIARVLDAGATDSGRPYFVMELVKGQPITQYCDEHHLSPRQRLELFLPVCRAIQHAHQKGIIHRDIKPTNILVAEYDQKAVPKVIDFGVAKATSQALTEKTMFTGVGQIVGTLEYMSPEQAKVNQLDIDTRSDIYSLGVLLYELLTSSTPFDKQRLCSAAWDEMLRIIREEEPPKPSTRLSDSGEALASISAQRHMEPSKLSKIVRGELDWIVMKAIEKDRARRYETASGFAADVQHYLSDEPVLAGPPSVAYRFRKFTRRNRAALGTGLLLTLSIIVAFAGLAGGIGWAVRDRTARERQSVYEQTVRQAKISGQLEQILNETAQLELAEKWPEALASARRAESALVATQAAPELQHRVRQALADLTLVARLDEIRMWSGTPWRDVKERQRLSKRVEQEYAIALREAGIDLDTLPVEEAADRITSRTAIAAALLPALDDWVAVRSVGNDQAATQKLIDVLQHIDADPWRKQIRHALAAKDWPTLNGMMSPKNLDQQPASTLCFLHAALDESVLLGLEPELILRTAQRKYPADYWINHRLGVNLIWRRYPDDVREGIGYMRVAIAIRPHSAHARMNLGTGYKFLGQYDEAIACFRKAIELQPTYWACYSNLGDTLSRTGAYDEAMAALEKAIELSPGQVAGAYAELSMIYSSRPDMHLRNAHRAAELATKAIEIDSNFGNHWIALGIARYREGQWREARTAFEKSLGGPTIREGGTFRWEAAIEWYFLAMCHRQLGQNEDARHAYEKAVAWMEENQTASERLLRFQVEAEDLLGVTPPAEILAARRERGRRHLENGDISKAVAAFSGLIRLKPDVSWYWCDRGVAYLRSGEHEKAIADLTRAIELLDAPTERNLRGEAYQALGQWREAEADFSAAIELEPGSAQAWARRASARFNLQQLDGAIADYSRALELMPGRASEAEPFFREALRVRRQSLGEGDAATATIAFRLAQVLGTQKKFGEVETLLQDAHKAITANRASAAAREFEPVLIGWIIKQYQDWGMPQRTAEWERKLPPEDIEEKQSSAESK